MRQAFDDRERRCEEAIDSDHAAAASFGDLRPPDEALLLEAHGQLCAGEVGAGHVVIGHVEVRGKKPCWETQLGEAGCKAEVIAHVVSDVPAFQEGRLGDVDKVLEWPLHAVGQNDHDQLDIAVEQCDGAVADQLFL